MLGLLRQAVCRAKESSRPKIAAQAEKRGTRRFEIGNVPLGDIYKDTRVSYEGQSIGSLLEAHTRFRVNEATSADPPLSPRGPESVRRLTNGPEEIGHRESARDVISGTRLDPVVINTMHVVKRDGREEPVSFDKITARLRQLVEDPFAGYTRGAEWSNPLRVIVDADPHVTGRVLGGADPVRVSQKVCNALYDKVRTRELDELSAETAMAMSTINPDYGVLASRIAVSNLHKETPATLKESFERLGRERLNAEIYDAVVHDPEIGRRLETAIDYTRDYQCDFFAIKTLVRVYLLTDSSNQVAERPQHMFMRVALGIHGPHDLRSVLETYKLMSERYFTHATPTLFNAGTTIPQCSSCYLYGITADTDSISGIYDTLKKCALISKYGGGIGLHVHDVRARGSKIKGTNGMSTGIVPMLKVFNDTARYVNQSGKRKGSIAVYLEPWHADVMSFLDLKRNHGLEEDRARDLFYALWIPDLFMRRVEEDGEWTLFCPSKARGLADAYGEEFDRLYERLEADPDAAAEKVRARTIWSAILTAQVETGVPYILFKDACNKKSNQKNLGTIRSSNLCTEIVQYSSVDECSVCNLASLSIPKFVRRGPYEERPYVDYEEMHGVVKVMVRNLNKVIDNNYYPIKEAMVSNLRHRPIGVGVQGFADALFMMRVPFESAEAKKINVEIFETIYHAAVEASVELAAESGPYETYEGSPASQGTLQFDMWGVQPSAMYDWDSLKQKMLESGLRNSLLVAPMPTASTAQILGNNEGFEPIQTNMFVRKTLAGEFLVINKYLVQDLQKLGLWTKAIKDSIVKNKGSVQAVREIPDDIKALYKTAYEIKQRAIIDMAADRGPFICQSQSLNLFLERPRFDAMTSMLFYGWKKGLKTGQYYLRSMPAADPIAVTVMRNDYKRKEEPEEGCEMCSS